MSYNLKSIIPMCSLNITLCYPYFSSRNCIFFLRYLKEETLRYTFLIELDHNILHINKHNNRLYVSTTERFYILNFNGKILMSLKIKSLKCFIENEDYLFISTDNKLDIYNINYDRLRFILLSRIDAKNINQVSVQNNMLYYTEELKLKTYCFKTHEIKNILYSKSNILNFIVKDSEIVLLTETQFIRRINTTYEIQFINFLQNSEKLKQIYQISNNLYTFIYETEIKFIKLNEDTSEEIFSKTFDEKIKKSNFIKTEGSMFVLLNEQLVLLTKGLDLIFEFHLPKLNTFDILNNQILIASDKQLFLYENNSQTCIYKPDDEIFRVFFHSNSICISIFRNGLVDLYDTNNSISFRKFQLELPIDEIEKHNDLLVCSSMNKISIHDIYGKNLMTFELQGNEKLRIQKISAFENCIFILTYQNILRYDLTTSNQISFDIKANTFDINEKYIILSLNSEITILNHNLEFIRSFKYELEGRRRDEKFFNIKTATSIIYMNNLVFISGNCNQLRIYYEKYLIDTLLISRNKDLEGYKKTLGKEKDLNTPVLKSDIIKCIKMEKNTKTRDILLQTQHDIRIYGLNELKYEPVELSENLKLEDINEFIKENKLQKALTGCLMLNDNRTIKQVVYKLYNTEKSLLENIIRSIEERFMPILENFLNKELLNANNSNLNYGLLIFIKEVVKRTVNKGRIELWEKKLREFYMKSKKSHILKSPKV